MFTQDPQRGEHVTIDINHCLAYRKFAKYQRYHHRHQRHDIHVMIYMFTLADFGPIIFYPKARNL